MAMGESALVTLFLPIFLATLGSCIAGAVILSLMNAIASLAGHTGSATGFGERAPGQTANSGVAPVGPGPAARDGSADDWDGEDSHQAYAGSYPSQGGFDASLAWQVDVRL
jgi:hypothetical protein